ncbi:MAG: N-acetyl-gamma-glutamyl-phosphate reductase [Spirochaetales bacterium]|jgi:N-acetyl-gamma-glutamyl-phosphate reductase|nr:N-acetyl-gamma-glutamyl-phosphate reductase [Spirochaetales bacterium]
MVKVKLVGAGGYGGVGAIEILSRHPEAELVALVDLLDTGKPISELYPHLSGICDMVITHPDDDSTEADVVFFSTPDRVGMKTAPAYFEKGYKIIDYSGDFRFNTEAVYAEYASRINLETNHLSPELLSHSAYGLSEFHRKEITDAKIVGNPGCFAVSSILGAGPAVAANLIDLNTLVFDAKTGVSGAGKKAHPLFHYPHRYDEMNAYKMCKHQHVMEIERELGLLAGKDVQITFNTQVIPVVRGIMTSVYAKVNEGVNYDSLLAAYRDFYANEPFITVTDESGTAGNRHIRGTNRCVLWINLDRRTGTMVIMSHIDNLLKGQAGSAVQNMNILFGLNERAGLETPGLYP